MCVCVIVDRHLVGFLLFLGLTIYTATHVPVTIVEPKTLQRWQSGIMESWPSYMQLPEAFSGCVTGTYDGSQCVQVPPLLRFIHYSTVPCFARSKLLRFGLRSKPS